MTETSSAPSSRQLVLLLLALALSAPLAQALTDVALPPFTPYPPTDNCGPPTEPGSYSGNSCPTDVCGEERKACEAANGARARCKFTGCAAEEMNSASANATSACAEAAKCVRGVCYSSKPANGGGDSCRVRSFYKGQCCCATCADDAPDGRYWASDFEGGCGANNQMTPVPGNPGLLLGQCAWIHAPGYSYYELSGCVQAYWYSWAVHLLCLRRAPAGEPFKYKILVSAHGPWFSWPGNWYMYFTEATGKRHELKLNQTNKDARYYWIPYNSKKPTIVKVQWSTTRL